MTSVAIDSRWTTERFSARSSGTLSFTTASKSERSSAHSTESSSATTSANAARPTAATSRQNSRQVRADRGACCRVRCPAHLDGAGLHDVEAITLLTAMQMT